MMMGQAIGVSSSYMKPTQEEMLQEYAKGIDNLTVLGPRETVSEETVLTTIRREMLSARYNEQESRVG